MTSEELIAELAAIMSADGPEDAYTTGDLCELLGLSAGSVRRRLKVLAKAKRLQVVTVQRQAIDGVYYPTTAYRIKSA